MGHLYLVGRVIFLLLIILLFNPVAVVGQQVGIEESIPGIPISIEDGKKNSGQAVPTPVFLVTRGGISMGSYQAGVNWAIAELIAASRDSTSAVRDPSTTFIPHILKGSAGASAGNINSVLTAIKACSEATFGERPESSAFWKVWVNTGLEQLMPDQRRPYREQQREGLLHLDYYFGSEDQHHRRLPSHLKTLDKALDVKSSECQGASEYPIGITLTPDTNLEKDLEGIVIPSKRSIALLSVGMNSDGKLGFRQIPSRYLNPVLDHGDIVEPERDAFGNVSLLDVIRVSAAGSAFPVAFSPIQLELLTPTTREDESVDDSIARRGTQISQRYLDGGVFDNRPISTVFQFYKGSHLSVGSRDLSASWGEVIETFRKRVLFDDERFEQTAQVRFAFVAPLKGRGSLGRLNSHFDSRTSIERVSDLPPGLAAVSRLSSTFVPAARRYELYHFLRQLEVSPERLDDKSSLEDSLFASAFSTTDRSRAIVGSRLHAFAAFMGRPFREYDFYVGLYDGMYWFARNIPFGIAGAKPTVAKSESQALEKVRFLVRYLDESRSDSVGMTSASLTVLNKLLQQDSGILNPLDPDLMPSDGDSTVYIYHNRLLEAVSDAIEKVDFRDREDIGFSCTAIDFVEQHFCKEGILELLENTVSELQNKHATKPIKTLEYLARFEEVNGFLLEMKPLSYDNTPVHFLSGCVLQTGYPYSYPCLVGAGFLGYAENPPKATARLYESILNQLWSLEDFRGDSGRPSMEGLVETAQAAYRFGLPIPTRSWLSTSTSLPRKEFNPRASLLRLLPYHISWGSEIIGKERGLVDVSGSPDVNPDSLNAQFVSYSYSAGYRFSLGGQAKPVVINTDAKLLTNPSRVGFDTSIGYQMHFSSQLFRGLSVMPLGFMYDARLGWQYAFSADLYMLGNRAKTYIKVMPANSAPHRIEFGFGITDIVGTAYWAIRRAK